MLDGLGLCLYKGVLTCVINYWRKKKMNWGLTQFWVVYFFVPKVKSRIDFYLISLRIWRRYHPKKKSFADEIEIDKKYEFWFKCTCWLPDVAVPNLWETSLNERKRIQMFFDSSTRVFVGFIKAVETKLVTGASRPASSCLHTHTHTLQHNSFSLVLFSTRIEFLFKKPNKLCLCDLSIFHGYRHLAACFYAGKKRRALR